ncbi:unnamed protein product [Lota lota]
MACSREIPDSPGRRCGQWVRDAEEVSGVAVASGYAFMGADGIADSRRRQAHMDLTESPHGSRIQVESGKALCAAGVGAIVSHTLEMFATVIATERARAQNILTQPRKGGSHDYL